MKKVKAILEGKMDKVLLTIKVKKIDTAMSSALLNAEDDLAKEQLKYEETLAKLADTSDITSVLADAVACKRRITAISEVVETIKEVKADLESDVTPVKE